MPRRPPPTIWDFNQEIISGECGSLGMAYVAAYLAREFTRRPAIISAAIVAGTLSGGTMLWLAARIFHRGTVRGLAGDIGYFTPAALILGFLVYDPAIFFASHHLLSHGRSVASSVILSQLLAFTLFLGCMNLYRYALLKIAGKRL